MPCLSKEQLVALALGLVDESTKPLQAHIDECARCRTKLADTRRLIERLSAAHAKLDGSHAVSRTRLLANLSNAKVAERPSSVWNRRIFKVGNLTMRQRIAAIGIGLSALAAVAIVSMAINSGHQLSAMERMAKELNEVKSYSYKTIEHVTIAQKGKPEPGIVDFSRTVYWRTPGAIREELKIVLNGAVPAGYHRGQAETDIVAICLTDKPGIFIDLLGKTFRRETELRAEDTGSGSLTYPDTLLRAIREGSGKVVRDLGTKTIQGKHAHGYTMQYRNDSDPMEVWIDPQTDLPLEVNSEAKDETTTEVTQLTDFRWDIELDPKLFDTKPPAGYTDITPPCDVKSLAEISAALRLYADLSGGHYPKVDTERVNATFDADAVYAEMLKIAGKDKEHQEIQHVKAGLDWIAKITRNRGNARFDGMHVGPNDKDKILFWWFNGRPEGYQVFYGDLHPKILNKAEAEADIPPRPKIFAEPAEDEQKPTEKP
ncbi:MAG TPA: hypothetical protein VGJ04_05170 [Pirellulales bacterium]